MSKADDAYEEALRRIAEAKEEGTRHLNLKLGELEVIPPEIADLPALRWLEIDNTKVTDFAPLAEFKQLTRLDLINTQISDATPLSGLVNLTELDLEGTHISDATPLSGLVNLTRLDLSGTRISDARPLSVLVNLTGLYLNDTQISDARPLSGLVNLTGLYLSGTQISDLRPLNDLGKLASDDVVYGGLHIRNTPATRHDPELARLAEIEGGQERTQAILEYLKSLPDDDVLPAAPIQDGALQVALTEAGMFDVEAAHPDSGEAQDRVKRLCHEQLRSAAQDLERLSGNMHAMVNQRVRAFCAKLNLSFEELDMLDLHFGVEMFRDMLEKRDERRGDDVLSPEIVAALGEVVRLGPGLVRDNDEVEAFEDRRARNDVVLSGEEAAKRDELLEALEQAENLMGPLLRDYARQAKGQDPSSRRGYAGQTLTKNVIISVTTWLALETASAAYGQQVSALLPWLAEQAATIVAVAAPFGEGLLNWVAPIMDAVRQSGGSSVESFRTNMEKLAKK